MELSQIMIFEERAFDMGTIGELNEPMLNFTLDISTLEISLDLKTELFEYYWMIILNLIFLKRNVH